MKSIFIKLALCLFLISIVTFNANSQTLGYEWAKGIGEDLKDMGYSITIDDTSNIYVAGHFSNVVDFDPGSGVTSLTGGDQTKFFAKYNSSGDLVWAHCLDGGTVQMGSGITISLDKSNNIYLAGGFEGTIDFDPGTGVNSISATVLTDIFFAKYDNSGNLIWVNSLRGSMAGTQGTEHIQDLAIDTLGNIYVTGNFYGTIDFNAGGGVANLTSV